MQKAFKGSVVVDPEPILGFECWFLTGPAHNDLDSERNPDNPPLNHHLASIANELQPQSFNLLLICFYKQRYAWENLTHVSTLMLMQNASM